MSLRRAAKLALEAAELRDEAALLSESRDPADKAAGALASRKADMAAECAQGAIRNDLGLSNDMGAGLRERDQRGTHASVSEVTLYRAIRNGQFPAIKVRGRYVVPASALDAMEHAAVDTGGLVDAAATGSPRRDSDRS